MAKSSLIIKSIVVPAVLASGAAWLAGPKLAALLAGTAGALVGWFGWSTSRTEDAFDALDGEYKDLAHRHRRLGHAHKRLKAEYTALKRKHRRIGTEWQRVWHSDEVSSQSIITPSEPIEQTQWKQLVANAGLGLMRLGTDWRVIEANSAAAQAFGFSSVDEMASLIHDLPRDLLTEHSDFRSAAQEAEDSLHWQRCTGLPGSPAEGQILGIAAQPVADGEWMLLVEDMTAREQAADLLKQADTELKQAHRSRAEFLQHVSHELRTPLNQILGFADVMLKQPQAVADPSALADCAAEIHASGLKLLGMVEAVMEINRIEAGLRRINDGPVELNRSLKKQIEQYRHRADVTGIRFTVDIQSDLPILKAEEKSLREMIDHLAFNAFAATPEGGSICLSAWEDGDGSVAISIKDSGIGMTDIDCEKAMSPFGKVDAPLSQLIDGAGLGLNIVQALASMHKARFSLVSEEGKGTEVQLHFPAERSIIRRAA
ncbi:MAG: hypothetical protein Alpg2KO_14070 [Alphaproteobacteria bacterium]